MGKRIINRKNTYRYGNYKEIEIFPVYSGTHTRLRGEKTNKTKKAQKELNKRNKIKKIFRLLNANFKKGDYFLTMTYAPGFCPETIEEATAHYQKFMKKLRALYKKTGKELKYMAWIEKGVEKGRIHHHLVISGGVSREEIENLFGYGYCNCDVLKPEIDDLKGLAEYFAKDPKGKRTFTCSKNLDRTCLLPKEVENNKTSKHEVKQIIENFEDKDFIEKKYPGYELVGGEVRKNEYMRHAYVYLMLRKKGCYDIFKAD